METRSRSLLSYGSVSGDFSQSLDLGCHLSCAFSALFFLILSLFGFALEHKGIMSSL
jgi:hypothetical protein